MKKITLLATLLFFSFSPAYALLSPLNESIREMDAILKSKEVQNLPQSESIQLITRTQGGYLLVTNNNQLFVEIRYVKQNRPGPREFNVIFREPTKLMAE